MELRLGIRNIKPKYPEIAQEMRQQLGKLDGSICNTFFWPGINQLLLHYLKNRTSSREASDIQSEMSLVGTGKRPTKHFSQYGKKEIITKRPLGNLA